VKRNQLGATAVEFALVLMLFLMFMLGIVDFSRMLYTWSAANEATRAGARYAAVCDSTGNSAQVLARMQLLMPQIQNIQLAWNPPSCDPTTCEGVTVTIQNMNYRWISPLAGFITRADIPMPGFSTYLTREAMRQDPHSGDIC
jgi:Flp pilus assembly protein TadG